jgi:hypothetical protein
MGARQERGYAAPMKGSGIVPWGAMALLVLVASPVSRMIGDPVDSVWLIGTVAVLLGVLAVLRSARGSRRS